MRIYLAARYGRRLEMLALASRLREQGHEITSRWLEGETEECEEWAVRDAEDVARAEILVFHAEPHRSSNVGGGRHWEFGYAWALGRVCIVVGERETIFCHLPGLIRVDDADDLVAVTEGLN